MGYFSKVLAGAVIGVGAIAAAPFTGGGSLLGGASLAASLLGAGGIAAATAVAGGTVGAVAQNIENSRKEDDIKNAKESSFEDGMKEGKQQTVNEVMKFVDFYLATTALSYYCARCDGSISYEEQLEIDSDLDAIIKNIDIPHPIRKKLYDISNNENLTFEEVTTYLDKVSIETLRGLEKDIDEIISASEGITPEEKIAKKRFVDYLRERDNE